MQKLLIQKFASDSRTVKILLFGNDAITGGIQTKTDDCFPAVADEDEESASNPQI